MVLGCGNNFVKYFLFAANFFVCVFGAIIAGISLWATLDKHFTETLRTLIEKAQIHNVELDELSKYQGSLWVLVVVGLLLCVFGFIGCCGTACESTTLLGLYIVIIMLLAVIEIAAIAFAISNKGKFHDTLEKILDKGFENSTDVIRAQLKPIQDLFHCCGSTLKMQDKFIDDGICPGDLKTAPDCMTTIWNWMNKSGTWAISIAFIVLVIEIVALIATFVLCAAVRARDRGYAEL